MALLYLDNIVHTYASKVVLDGVTWEIQEGQKIGLVGPNGAGKSTLLKLITGDLVPDSGVINRQKRASIGYLAQEPELNPEHVVWQEVLSASSEVGRGSIFRVYLPLETQAAELAGAHQ